MDGPRQPRLLDLVRERIRTRHMSYRTEKAYVGWIRRFILFHGKRHPRGMGATEVEAFLSHLANARHVAAATQNQALAALLFLYREVLGVNLPWMDGIVRAKRPRRLPPVLSRDEVGRVLDALGGKYWLAAGLMYGAGLRVVECLRLRVKDMDIPARRLTVRDGKGGKDRVSVLPEAVLPALDAHLRSLRLLHERDVGRGLGRVYLPFALARKYPRAGREWGWQFMFPSGTCVADRDAGDPVRHHLHEKAVAAKTVSKPLCTLDSQLESKGFVIFSESVISTFHQGRWRGASARSFLSRGWWRGLNASATGFLAAFACGGRPPILPATQWPSRCRSWN